jgi:DNA-binding CsgD family transcriptional regulator
MLLEGFTSPAIAEDLGISVNTVKGYMKTMYRKCGVISKAELIRLATSDTKDV